jgi:hypothetical protein
MPPQWNIGELLELRARQAVFFKRDQVHWFILSLNTIIVYHVREGDLLETFSRLNFGPNFQRKFGVPSRNRNFSTLKLEKGCLFFLAPSPLSRRVGKTTLAAPGLDPERQRARPQPVRGGCEHKPAGPLRRPQDSERLPVTGAFRIQFNGVIFW